MQDRYAGDIGDFAKFAVLRALVYDSTLRLGLVWYLTSQPGDPAGDGRHVNYLDRSPRNNELFRACDPYLYDALARLVSTGVRKVDAYPALKVLPEDTAYFDAPLVFEPSTTVEERVEVRSLWNQQALAETAQCQIVMFDPDNGLPVQSAGKTSAKGPKYVFFDELAGYVARQQSVVVYQHAIRSGTFSEQVRSRLNQLKAHLELDVDPFALIWRPFSIRAFLVAPTAQHGPQLLDRAKALTSGPLGHHIELHQ